MKNVLQLSERFSRFLIRFKSSHAEENLNLIEEEGPIVVPRLWKSFLSLERKNDNEFRAFTLLRSRRSMPHIYGGQIVAQALKSACLTVGEELPVHSMHSYFIKAGTCDEPVDYRVERLRDGQSFATRAVRAIQNDEIIFSSQVSFHKVEKSAMKHQIKYPMPQGPEGFKTLREILQERLDYYDKNASDKSSDEVTKFWLGYKLFEFPNTFHGIFEVRPVNQDLYDPKKPGANTDPQFDFWVRPTIPIGNDFFAQRLFAAYISDSTMLETALIPHIVKGYVLGMAFSLDHCMWFHQPNFVTDDWMLWEQFSEYAGGNRSTTRGRLWSKDGDLILSAMQEGVSQTHVSVHLKITCAYPAEKRPVVFLMEEDFGEGDEFYSDEDDLLDHAIVEYNRFHTFEGSELEFDGIEPYIFISYICNPKDRNLVESRKIYLDSTIFSMKYTVLVDLVPFKVTITSARTN
ncbi:unnamed protein product [Caenorhabditis auriculariae]|uniref:Acyl-CoA thioesterase II n=1 Tax=Caenorhabditis auriculariae TaxID=2777116 RepID=A0A8S1GPA4_9PELO|nr:unnamed protein product [Caenorhabditis auriculariae]